MNPLPPQPPRSSNSQFGELVRDLKALPFNALFPFREWIQAGLLRQPLTRAILLLALFPLGIYYFLGQSASIQTSGWAFGLYFAGIWAYLLYLMVRPQNIRWSAALGVGVFTTVVGIATVLFVQKFPVISWLYAATDSPFSPLRLIGFILGVGLLEEAVKLAPVAYLVIKLREVRDLQQAAYYAGISGLAFGVAEAASYLYLYRLMDIGQLAYGGPVNNGNTIILQMVRLITLPFLHCMFTSIGGYYVGLSLYNQQKRKAWIVFGVLLAATIHGLYDFFSTSYLGIVVAAITILLFAGYLHSSRNITGHVESEKVYPGM